MKKNVLTKAIEKVAERSIKTASDGPCAMFFGQPKMPKTLVEKTMKQDTAE